MDIPVKIPYAQHRSQLKTGDLIFQSGTSLFSRLIRWVTRSPWSHAGMVIRFDSIDMVAMLESSAGKRWDMATKKYTKGVQISPLSARVLDAKTAVRPLKEPLDSEDLRRLGEFRNCIKGKKYESNFKELARAALDLGITRKNRENLSELFCSELVAEAYQCLGFLDHHKPSNEFTPSDLACMRSRFFEDDLIELTS